MMLKAVLVALALLPRFHEDREAVGKVSGPQSFPLVIPASPTP